jgi:hypothetical protein
MAGEKDPPNIILYDWKDDAAVTSVTEEKFAAIKNELGRFSATSLTIRDKLLKTAANNLVAGVGSGLEYAVRVASLRPNGEAHGQALADYLAGEILEGRVDPSAPIQLIGHSAGGFVASNCGRLLMSSEHWKLANITKKPMKFQVTTLDTPILQAEQIKVVGANGGRFERYVSSLVGEFQLQNLSRLDPNEADKLFGVSAQSQMSVSTIHFVSPSTPEFSESATYHHGIDVESAELAWFFFILRHVKSHEWYINTVQNPISFGEGFYYAPLPWGNVFPGAAPLGAPSFAMFAESAAAPPPSLSGFALFGNVTEASAGTYTLTEQGNAGIYQDVTLPMNVSTVKFRVQFTQAGDGDFIEVNFGNHLSLAVIADGAILRAGPTEFEVPVVAFGGETGQLLIKLNGVGADNAIAVVGNISITTDDDSDSDGLTFAQETTLGTDPRYYDTDSDGIGDWEEVNTTLTNPLLADSDADGLTDAQEIIAGTSGVDATSVFRTTGTTRAANGAVTVTWAAKAGKTYRVQRSDTPDFTNYTVVGDDLPGVEPTTSFIDSTVPGGTQRLFYRVEVE